jgi:hypothetical protein
VLHLLQIYSLLLVLLSQLLLKGLAHLKHDTLKFEGLIRLLGDARNLGLEKVSLLL